MEREGTETEGWLSAYRTGAPITSPALTLKSKTTDPKGKIKLAFQHVTLYLHLSGSMLSHRCGSFPHCSHVSYEAFLRP